MRKLKIKHLLPFEDIEYISELSPEEVIDNIRLSTEPERAFRMFQVFGFNNHRTFEGSVLNNTFNIKRIKAHSGLSPIIMGVVLPKESGSMIKIKIGLDPNMKIFMLIWYAFLTFMIFMDFIDLKISILSNVLPFWGMGLLAYLLILLSFKFESNKSQETFERIFNAKPID